MSTNRRQTYLNARSTTSPVSSLWEIGNLVATDPQIPNKPLEVASGDATASGVTLSVAISTISGAATGGASASGQTITDNVTIISGAATGGASASGQTITDNVTIIEGVADGGAGGPATAPGGTIAFGVTLTAGVAMADNPQGQVSGAPAVSEFRRVKKRKPVAQRDDEEVLMQVLQLFMERIA